MKLSKLFGVHAVQAALDYSAKTIEKAWVDEQRQDRRVQALVKELLSLGIQPEKADRKKLDKLADGKNHQGIVVEVTLPSARSETELKQAVETISGTALILVLDHVQDPHNFGACLRSADATGVDAVIITKDNASGITPTVCKVACGAAETVPVYQVTNLARTLRWLKDQGIWIMGAAGETEQSAYQTDFTAPTAIVMGAEEKGLRRLTREQCDQLIKLPMQGRVESLNVSVATGVLLYEVVRQRLFH